MRRKSARALWTNKLSNKQNNNLSTNTWTVSNLFFRDNKVKGIVLGIDASLRGTGLAVLDFCNKSPILIFSKKIICSPKLHSFECIGHIFREIMDLILLYPIDHAAIEQTVYIQNCKIALTLGAVKGAIVAALAGRNLPIFEYEPLRIKQAVTGFGRASKEQIKKTVCEILHVSQNISYDEGDAAATALCHAWTYKHPL